MKDHMLKSAIVGCGRIAGGYDRTIPTKWNLTHAGGYHLCPKVELVAVADPDFDVLKSFQKKWDVPRGYQDYKELMEKESIDIISLCLPTEQHYEGFKSAIEHDIKAIFCEKPLSYDLNTAQRMVEMGKGRVVSVNYFRRWNTKLANVVHHIKSGTYGKCISVTIRYNKGIFVNGSHYVDLMRWFFGDPKEVNFMRIVNDDPVDPGVDFCLTFNDGTTAYFINIPKTDYVFQDVDILMEKGRFVIGQRGQTLTTCEITPEPYHNLFNILSTVREEQTQWQECMTRAIDEIISCMENGVNSSCTLEDAYRAMGICMKVLSDWNTSPS